MKKYILILLGITLWAVLLGQGIGISTDGSTADASAILEVKSSAHGILMPRLTAAQITSISSPATGLIVFQTDGSKGFYVNVGTPSTPDWQLLVTSDILGNNTSILPGVIRPFASNTIPNGYLLCDGSAVSRTTYAALFSIIGTTYGSGDGSSTFNLPDLRGRTAPGRDPGDTSFDVLNETGGAKSVSLTTSNLPSHQHSVSAISNISTSSYSHSHTYNDYTPTRVTRNGYTYDYMVNYPRDVSWTTGDAIHSHTFNFGNYTTDYSGSGTATNIMQPYAVVNYIIKY